MIPKSVIELTISMFKDDLKLKLEEKADKMHISVASLIRIIVAEYLAKN